MFDVQGSFFFSSTTNLANHDNRFSGRVFFKQSQNVYKVGTRYRISTDTHTGGLTKSGVCRLLDRFIGQGARAGYNPHPTRQMNVTGHDANFGFTWRDHTGAVWPDQSHTQFITLNFAIEHIQRGNTFCNTDNQFDSRIGSLKNGILAKRCRYIDN